MSWPVFLLRLVGKSPEQVKVQEDFKRALEKMDDLEEELDGLLVEIRSVDQTMKQKNRILGEVSSAPPPRIKEGRPRGEEHHGERTTGLKEGRTTPSKA